MHLDCAPWLQGACYPGRAWVRIAGRGIQVQDTRRYPLLLSERTGGRRLPGGPWSVRWLAQG